MSNFTKHNAVVRPASAHIKQPFSRQPLASYTPEQKDLLNRANLASIWGHKAVARWFLAEYDKTVSK